MSRMKDFLYCVADELSLDPMDPEVLEEAQYRIDIGVLGDGCSASPRPEGLWVVHAVARSCRRLRDYLHFIYATRCECMTCNRVSQECRRKRKNRIDIGVLGDQETKLWRMFTQQRKQQNF